MLKEEKLGVEWKCCVSVEVVRKQDVLENAGIIMHARVPGASVDYFTDRIPPNLRVCLGRHPDSACPCVA